MINPYLLLDDAFPATAINRKCFFPAWQTVGCTVQHLEMGLGLAQVTSPFPGPFGAELCFPCLVPTNPSGGGNLYCRETIQGLVSGESSGGTEQGNRELRDHLALC